MLSRSVSALAAGVLSSAGLAEGPAPRPRRRPNIIFILIDDMGWTDLGCYGSKYFETPNIDRLAAQGLRFTNAYAACAVCSPTRASILTGRYPARVGITDWIRAGFQGGKTDGKTPTEYVGSPAHKLLCPPNPFWLELDEVTLAEALKPAGYATGHVGKWHLGPKDHYPDTQGFDVNRGGCDYGQPPSYFDPYSRKGQEGIPHLPPRKEGEYLTDREADEAVDFIRQNKDRPFFLYLAHYAVHTPLMGKKDLVEKYKAKPAATAQKNATYAAMVESVDAAVGKVLAALEELKLDQDTIVFFTSDNGGLLGSTSNLPLRSGKGYPYEGGIREPLIVRWTGTIPPGKVSDQVVTSVDYFPTILEAAGVAPPAERAIDGVSLLPHLLRPGDQPLAPRAVYWHFPHYRGKDVVPYSIIREGDWKLIRRYEGRPFELFNLAADPSETTDRADAESDRVCRLNARLEAWLTSVGAKMPRPNPAYQAGKSNERKVP